MAAGPVSGQDIDLEAQISSIHHSVDAQPSPPADAGITSSSISSPPATTLPDPVTLDTTVEPSATVGYDNRPQPIGTADSNAGLQQAGARLTAPATEVPSEEEHFTIDEWWPKDRLFDVKLSDLLAEVKAREDRAGKLALAATFFATLQAALLALVLPNNQAESDGREYRINDVLQKVLFGLGAVNIILLMSGMLLALYFTAKLSYTAAQVKESHAVPYSFWTSLGLVQTKYRPRLAPFRRIHMADYCYLSELARDTLLSNEIYKNETRDSPDAWEEEIPGLRDMDRHRTPLESMNLARGILQGDVRLDSRVKMLRPMLQALSIQEFRRLYAQDNVSYYDACRICYGCAGLVIVWLFLYIIAQPSIALKIAGTMGACALFLAAILPSLKFYRSVKRHTKKVEEEHLKCTLGCVPTILEGGVWKKGSRLYHHDICTYDWCMLCNATRVTAEGDIRADGPFIETSCARASGSNSLRQTLRQMRNVHEVTGASIV